MTVIVNNNLIKTNASNYLFHTTILLGFFIPHFYNTVKSMFTKFIRWFYSSHIKWLRRFPLYNFLALFRSFSSGKTSVEIGNVKQMFTQLLKLWNLVTNISWLLSSFNCLGIIFSFLWKVILNCFPLCVCFWGMWEYYGNFMNSSSFTVSAVFAVP